MTEEEKNDLLFRFSIKMCTECQGINLLKKENAELKNVVKLLIATLNDTTWDEGQPGYADSEPGYRCPNCSCKDCYRISCQYNESELFKKLYKEFPELYEK